MKQQIMYTLPFLLSAVAALPTKREVPQEHAHQAILDQIDALLALDNPDNIQASVFGLLGAKAAAGGAGNIADADCLQQATADQAFTNAKAAGDIAGQTAALIYRGLERNTGSVGLASVPCVSIQAVNVEIAAIQQHQDPAGDGAAALNKEITLEIARQIQAIGGNPLDALEASTFAPGQIGDPTAKGNTCDDENDKAGCINTLKLRVDDATPEEIQAAVANVAAGGNANQAAAGNADLAAACNAQLAAAGNANEAAGNQAAAGNANEAAANANANEAAAGNANQAAAGGAGGKGLGSCADATIKFGIPSDGRKEDAFEATDLTNFNHGSALNIKVISGFICDQAKNKCDASDAEIATCQAAASAANGLSGQAAADAFNGAL